MDYRRDVIDPGDRFSELARAVCVESFSNSPAIKIVRGGAGMRAMDGFRWRAKVRSNMVKGGLYQVGQSDGAGGKPQFFTLCNTPEAFSGLAWEVITMNVDDVACRGGLPVMLLSSNLDIKQITDQNWRLCEALLNGLGHALRESHLALLTGETAVMRDSITAFCDRNVADQLVLTWNATCIGLASERRAPNGATVTPGMVVVGFRDKGYRCNGGTKFTNIILDTWGPKSSWRNRITSFFLGESAVFRDIMNNSGARSFIEKLVVPSQSYAQTIARLNGWELDGTLGTPLAKLHGVAHITGGGVWSKLQEILPEGVGVVLDTMPTPPDVLLQAQQLASKTAKPMSDYECYGTFHGGCGMMVICKQEDVPRVMDEARKDGHDPHVVGRTVESVENEITIISKFQNGYQLSSLHPQ